MYNTSFIKKLLLVATVVLLYSCDKDFNAIGGDLIGDNHFGLEQENYDVKAYNQKVTPVASNNLTVNPLGIYDDPVFGITTANFNTQAVLAEYAPTIGEGVEVDSVTLNIPYFVISSKTVVNSNGSSTYVLDSIYGDKDKGKLKLSVYESGYYMNDIDQTSPTQTSQLYYTNQNSDFEGVKKTLLNDSSNQFENEAFSFSNEEIILKSKNDAGADVVTRVKPEMRLHLNKAFFADKFLNSANASNLATADVFKNYFRGLYFKVEKSGTNPTNMATMDFKKGKITIFYRAKTAITTDAEDVKEKKTLVLNLTGNTVSLQQESNATTDYTDATKNDLVADDKLYLKGGEGSMAIIELTDFNTQLAAIKTKGWLVNEANLVFNIDTDKAKNIDSEPFRVYLYNATDNIPIVDYIIDGTSSLTTDGKRAKYIYDGIISIDETTGKGKTYKIRLTNYIRNLIKNDDAVSVKLGLVVTDDISIVASNKLDPKGVINSEGIREVSRASVLNQKGTVLFGGTAASETKKLNFKFTTRNQINKYICVELLDISDIERLILL